MAWSDAARAAALAARRAHAKTRKTYNSSRKLTSGDFASKAPPRLSSYMTRKSIAKVLREYRRAGRSNDMVLTTPKLAGMNAAKSTYYRNMFRRRG